MCLIIYNFRESSYIFQALINLNKLVPIFTSSMIIDAMFGGFHKHNYHSILRQFILYLQLTVYEQ
jgi:hypothetical protein